MQGNKTEPTLQKESTLMNPSSSPFDPDSFHILSNHTSFLEGRRKVLVLVNLCLVWDVVLELIDDLGSILVFHVHCAILCLVLLTSFIFEVPLGRWLITAGHLVLLQSLALGKRCLCGWLRLSSVWLVLCLIGLIIAFLLISWTWHTEKSRVAKVDGGGMERVSGRLKCSINQSFGLFDTTSNFEIPGINSKYSTGWDRFHSRATLFRRSLYNTLPAPKLIIANGLSDQNSEKERRG